MFKVGDRVEVIDCDPIQSDLIGLTGIVTRNMREEIYVNLGSEIGEAWFYEEELVHHLNGVDRMIAIL